MIRTLLIAMALMMPLAAAAGPWPREVGRSFASMSVERDVEGNRYAGFYGEYGLTRRITLGVDLGHTDRGEASALFWAQRALDDGTGPHRFSLSSGLGAIRSDGQVRPLAQGALAWGRGFDAALGPGWISAQAQIRITGGLTADDDGAGEVRPATGFRITDSTVKTDLTLGLRPTERLMLINSLWLEDPRGGQGTAKLSSAIVARTGGPLMIELGVVQPLHGPAERAVRLGGWVEF